MSKRRDKRIVLRSRSAADRERTKKYRAAVAAQKERDAERASVRSAYHDAYVEAHGEFLGRAMPAVEAMLSHPRPVRQAAVEDLLALLCHDDEDRDPARADGEFIVCGVCDVLDSAIATLLQDLHPENELADVSLGAGREVILEAAKRVRSIVSNAESTAKRVVLGHVAEVLDHAAHEQRVHEHAVQLTGETACSRCAHPLRAHRRPQATLCCQVEACGCHGFWAVNVFGVLPEDVERAPADAGGAPSEALGQGRS